MGLPALQYREIEGAGSVVLSSLQTLLEDSDPLAGETVELGLAICLPVLVLLVFLGSVKLSRKYFISSKIYS